MFILQKNTKIEINSTGNLIKFYLNHELIELTDVGARDTLLDFLRLDRELTGTKEGCGEGDCGACTVLVGRISSGSLEYKTVNACICLLPSLASSHIVTVENLRFIDGSLHPVQQAMVQNHGSQCGFCTPGIVMSLYSAWLQSIEPTTTNIEKSLQGNLCRCTGYGPIISAAKSINNYGLSEEDKLWQGRAAMKNNLIDITSMQESLGKIDNSKFIIPYSLKNFADLFLEYPLATIVAGATDVGLWITKDLSSISPLIFIANLDDLKKIVEGKEQIEFGSCVTYSQAQPTLVKHFPVVDDYLSRIAGEQIRNVGTLGGNIGNGSPIGDLAPIFIALRGTMSLRKGEDTREVEIENFFLDYCVQDIHESEFIEKIFVPRNKNLFLFPYKISKRRDEDISTVSAVFSFEVLENKIVDVRLVFGGMAATPKRATNAENILEGKVFNSSVVKLVQLALETDFRPMSDMRASSAYRMQIAKNLIQKCQLEYEQNVKLQLI